MRILILSEVIKLEINRAIELALSGKALLFLGAGFSTEAYNINNQIMGDARKFSNFLCSEMGLPVNDDLSKVSNIYLKRNSVIEFVELLKKEFSCKDVRDYYEVITDINWNRVYTTNYDDVFEYASRRSNKSYASVTVDKDPAKYDKRNSIIHINGFIGTLTPDKLDNEFKLTSTSYNTSEFSKTKWAALFRNDLNNAKAIIFIGTSLNYDFELKQIINSNPNLKSKIIFIERRCSKEDVDIFELDAKDDFGSVEYIGLKEFTKRILDIKKEYKIKEQKPVLESFCYLNEEKYILKKPVIHDVWDLLIHGYIDENIVKSSFKDELYIIEREETNEVITRINDNKAYVAVVHADLGNGKSCFVRNLAEKVIPFGSVFLLNKSEATKSDIEIIDSFPGKKILVIENYHDHWRFIELLSNYLNDDYKLILTARTYIHETRYSELLSKLNNIDVHNINVNQLKFNDITKFIPLFDKVEKWNDYHGSSEYAKKKLLTKTYDSKMSNILIGMLKSKSIQRELDSIYDKIIGIQSFKELLIAICINSIIDLRLSSYDLVEILGIKEFSIKVKLNSEVRTIINWDDNQINVKSPIMAQYLLNEKIPKTDIINTVRKMVIYVNQYSVDNKYTKLKKRLISVSNIWLLLNQSDKLVRDLVIELFDSLKDHDFYREKPFFWLQYGIACLDNKIYDRAEEYFNLAYNKIRNLPRDFDTFQIDAHYARFLIENAIHINVYDNFESINKAHQLLVKSLNSEMQQHRYVLKQVELYKLYWAIYKHDFSLNDKSKLIKFTKYMIDKIEEYEVNKGEIEVYITKTKRNLESLITEILKSEATV